MSGFPTLMLFEAGKPVGAKTGLIDMQTALKCGVSQEKLGLFAGPNKALDIVLTKDQVENARKELDVGRGKRYRVEVGESRDKALSALNVVDGVFIESAVIVPILLLLFLFIHFLLICIAFVVDPSFSVSQLNSTSRFARRSNSTGMAKRFRSNACEFLFILCR